MKTYLEIQIPLEYETSWLEELRSKMKDFPIKWQKGFYHITLAFIESTPMGIELTPIIHKHFHTIPAPMISFDKIDVFTTPSNTHIIYLTATDIPPSFLTLTEAIRKDLKKVGCCLESDFRFHVTLGRIKDPQINISHLKKQINLIMIPSFSLRLTDVDYRIHKGRIIYQTKLK